MKVTINNDFTTLARLADAKKAQSALKKLKAEDILELVPNYVAGGRVLDSEIEINAEYSRIMFRLETFVFNSINMIDYSFYFEFNPETEEITFLNSSLIDVFTFDSDYSRREREKFNF